MSGQSEYSQKIIQFAREFKFNEPHTKISKVLKQFGILISNGIPRYFLFEDEGFKYFCARYSKEFAEIVTTEADILDAWTWKDGKWINIAFDSLAAVVCNFAKAKKLNLSISKIGFAEKLYLAIHDHPTKTGKGIPYKNHNLHPKDGAKFVLPIEEREIANAKFNPLLINDIIPNRYCQQVFKELLLTIMRDRMSAKRKYVYLVEPPQDIISMMREFFNALVIDATVHKLPSVYPMDIDPSKVHVYQQWYPYETTGHDIAISDLRGLGEVKWNLNSMNWSYTKVMHIRTRKPIYVNCIIVHVISRDQYKSMQNLKANGYGKLDSFVRLQFVEFSNSKINITAAEKIAFLNWAVDPTLYYDLALSKLPRNILPAIADIIVNHNGKPR